jgi:hypothetical protein
MTATAASLLAGIPAKLGSATPWEEKGGALWLTLEARNVRQLATAMNQIKARFVTATAYQPAGPESACIEYHWDSDGQLLGFRFPLPARSIASIYDLCEAADWIEREIHEGFAFEFPGREHEPLQLRQGDTLGVTLRESEEAK